MSTAEPKTWLAARALAHVLAGDQNSRLFREIRDRTGKTYGLRHRFDFFAPAGVFVVFGLIDANCARETIQLIEQSISRFLADGPTDDEHNNARRDMMTTYRQLLSDNVSSSNEIVALQLFGWPTDAINDVDDMIARLDLRAPEYRAAMLKGQPLTVIAGNAN
ncbi:insulinase family protein [Mesorhizobium sp.]|uniref:insulinase family protein n=1 Tax=Mesorhizobium sp. TaxID=1871066 RepID=UPI0025D2D699|nr:insulinase family protein [Mesorhizobium sp.]